MIFLFLTDEKHELGEEVRVDQCHAEDNEDNACHGGDDGCHLHELLYLDRKGAHDRVFHPCSSCDLPHCRP